MTTLLLRFCLLSVLLLSVPLARADLAQADVLISQGKYDAALQVLRQLPVSVAENAILQR